MGACRELIYGKDDEDAKLGQAGEIVPISNPSKLGQAILDLISNPELYQSAANVAKIRANKYYALTDVIDIYKQLYINKLGTST